MDTMLNRRSFLRGTSAMALLAAARAEFWLRVVTAAGTDNVVAPTSAGKVRGVVVDGVTVFKGIPYGGTTAGKNRFMPPTKAVKWTGVRDALAYGPTAPQIGDEGPRAGAPEHGEDCLVLNVFTPELGRGSKRPVMVWLHGGGFSTGSGSGAIYNGANLAHKNDVVLVSINHRLNVLGSTYLGEVAGPEFALSGCVGMLDIIAALHWVRENIENFGGDPNLVTIFGQSGGGRKVATLMSMPGAKGLFQRGIIESGALLRVTAREDAIRQTDLLLRKLGLQRQQARELQTIPVEKLLAADEEVQKEITLREPGMVADSPTVDGKALPSHPWDPAAPAISANIPLLIGWARTEETFYDRPTPEKLALDEAGLRERTAKRLGVDPGPVIEGFKKAYPDASPWDLYILIASDHPRAAYSRELAKRKVLQAGGPAYVYRFDWETPEGGGHMRSPHTVEIPFVFDNIQIAGQLTSKMSVAYTLAEKVSSSWAAFARTGDPNTPKLPNWPAYSVARRDTMLFNNECKVEQDPAQSARLAMERVLKLS
jgi:para-nitrobenzyl esterase